MADKLTLVEVGSSAAYGVVDIGTEIIDAQKGYTKPFQNITDIQRTVVTIGAGVLNLMEKGPNEVTEALTLSGIPLFEKTVYKAVKQFTGALPKGKGNVGLRYLGGGEGQPAPSAGVRYA